ncbi:hypothetical protein CULC0102_0519 [Corynebacterium ulcerans 0102]|nr:hypothetical protein CULC0102_0519 [Corynebacterium ulcerans 0102]BBJ71380.1 hypothetical protein CULC0211_05140 [Corynebacterium ulcerans]
MEVMSRVRVRRISQRVRNQLPWVAVNEDGRWLGNFTSWREAMDYADRQARTVEVTVPGDPCVRLPDGIRLRHSNIGWYVDCYGYFIVVPDNELKSLALALLSAHYRQYL